jgi:hypothetical protein|tara:strand:- start:2019 stop:2447 length:429 start_codon:yes stop_codon:yes gene_type:complete
MERSQDEKDHKILTSKQDDINKKLAMLDKKMSQQVGLMSELGKSVALQSIVPDAFEGGKAKIQMISTYPREWPKDYKMKVTKGSGDVVYIKLANVTASEETLAKLKPEGAKTKDELNHAEKRKEMLALAQTLNQEYASSSNQ